MGDEDKRFKRASFKFPANYKPEDVINNNTSTPIDNSNNSNTSNSSNGNGNSGNGNAPQPPPPRKITLGNRGSNNSLNQSQETKSPDTTDATNSTNIKNEMDEFDLDPVPISRSRSQRAATMIPSSILKDDRRKVLKIGTERTTNPDNNNNNNATEESDQTSVNKPPVTPPKVPPKRKSMALNQQQQTQIQAEEKKEEEDDEAIAQFSANSFSNILNKKQQFQFTNRQKGTGTGTINTLTSETGESQTSEEPSSRRGTFRKPIIIGTHQSQDDQQFIDETSQKLSSLDLANVERPKQQYHTIDPSLIPQWKEKNKDLDVEPKQQQQQQGGIKGLTNTFTSILKNSPLSKSNQSSGGGSNSGSSSNVSKGLTKGEVEYNEYLQKAKGAQFQDIEKLNFVYHAGKDNLGRTLIVVIASHLPVKETDMERVLLYTISIMDPVVEGDYVLVYCHTNMNNSNKPSFAWLKKVYTIFNRKYKKNLKGLYIVHPTSWIKFILGLFKPFLSKKFWRKLVYIDDLTDLFKFFSKEQLNLPSHVMMHRPSGKKLPPIFGAPLEEVVQRPDNPNEIPVLFEKGLSYLERRALQVEGLFRLSGANSQIKSLKAGFDAGEDVDLEDVDDVHTVAGLLKLYLRELPQPLFPFETYSSFIEIIKSDSPKPQKIESLRLLISLLPPANKALTKHLFKFLSKVVANANVNKMTAVNLSIVFAPNILKDGDNNILTQVSDTQFVNQVVQLILDNVFEIIPINN